MVPKPGKQSLSGKFGQESPIGNISGGSVVRLEIHSLLILGGKMHGPTGVPRGASLTSGEAAAGERIQAPFKWETAL